MHVITDETGREICWHGTEEFPFEFYCDNLAEYDMGCIDWHWHPEVEFAYAEKNTVSCFVDGEKIVLAQGEGLFINSNALHKYESADGGLLPNFLFLPEFIAPKDSVIFRNYVAPVIRSGVPYILMRDSARIAVMRALKAVSLSGGELKELHIHHLCETLWDALYRSGKGVFRWDAQSPVHDLSGYRVQAMMQYIRRQYAQHIYLADIAAAAHVSKSEALRCFRATVHTTPVEYLIEYRLATAARILKTENMKISDVAERVGFENISYFCRVFKRKYGLSPGQYRLNIRRRSL